MPSFTVWLFGSGALCFFPDIFLIFFLFSKVWKWIQQGDHVFNSSYVLNYQCQGGIFCYKKHRFKIIDRIKTKIFYYVLRVFFIEKWFEPLEIKKLFTPWTQLCLFFPTNSMPYTITYYTFFNVLEINREYCIQSHFWNEPSQLRKVSQSNLVNNIWFHLVAFHLSQ